MKSPLPELPLTFWDLCRQVEEVILSQGNLKCRVSAEWDLGELIRVLVSWPPDNAMAFWFPRDFPVSESESSQSGLAILQDADSPRRIAKRLLNSIRPGTYIDVLPKTLLERLLAKEDPF